MRIGKVANQVGITVEAIRFYEKQGLIEAPKRNESGYRDYPEQTVQHVSFIKRAKELGFSLKGNNQIQPAFIVCYMIGVLAMVVSDYLQTSVLSYFEALTFVASGILLVKILVAKK